MFCRRLQQKFWFWAYRFISSSMEKPLDLFSVDLSVVVVVAILE